MKLYDEHSISSNLKICCILILVFQSHGLPRSLFYNRLKSKPPKYHTSQTDVRGIIPICSLFHSPGINPVIDFAIYRIILNIVNYVYEITNTRQQQSERNVSDGGFFQLVLTSPIRILFYFILYLLQELFKTISNTT
jgi:hypothetical protein